MTATARLDSAVAKAAEAQDPTDAALAPRGGGLRGLMRRRLWARIVALFLVLLLAVQAATFLLIRASIERNARTAIAQELAVGERVLRRLLAQNVQRLGDSATVLAADFGFRAAVASADRETLSSALANHGGRIGASMAVLLDTAFELRGSGHPDGALLLPAVRGILAGLSDARLGAEIVPVDARPHQVVMVPVRAPLTVGWVVMGFPVDRGLVDDLRALSGLHATLLSRRDARQAWRVEVSTLADAAAREVAARLGDGDEPALASLRVADEPVGARVVPLAADAAGATVAVLTRSLEEAVAPYRQLQWLLAALTALGVLVFAAGSVVTARRVTTPIRALADAAERVGRGDYDTPVRVPGGDEIGELAATFDRMRENIGTQKREILHLAYWDRVTGLPNRAQFREAVERALQAGGPVSVLMLDLDRFKHVNDVLGYASGDALLTAFGQRLAGRLSLPGGLVARLGGDEFALLLPGADLAQARAVAGEIAHDLRRPLLLDGQPIDLGAGIGIAIGPGHGRVADLLISHAEIAMYAAKRGAHGPVVYDPAAEATGEQTLSLLTELRQAVRNGELRLFLQPKVALADGRLAGAEALVRWQHPRRGMVSPALFIPFAEQTGFIRELTQWVVEEAVRLWPALQAAGGPLTLAVNLSARDLLDAALIDRIAACFAAGGVAPSAFCLEITESTIMDDPQRARQTLQRLSEMGFRLAIDDFGTGYSSLAYLKRLPVDELKIDMSFVRTMDTDTGNARIVRSTIDLAHGLGLKVVAEGIETEPAWSMLREMGCEQGQGYLIGKPMPASAFVEWAADWAGIACRDRTGVAA